MALLMYSESVLHNVCVCQTETWISVCCGQNNADLTYTVGGAPHPTAQGWGTPGLEGVLQIVDLTLGQHT